MAQDIEIDHLAIKVFRKIHVSNPSISRKTHKPLTRNIFGVKKLAFSLGLYRSNKLDNFVIIVKKKFKYLNNGLNFLEKVQIISTVPKYGNHYWFEDSLTVRPDIPKIGNVIFVKSSQDIIRTKWMSKGNLFLQPAFLGTPRRIVGNLANTQILMNSTFSSGDCSGLSKISEYIIGASYRIFGIKI